MTARISIFICAVFIAVGVFPDRLIGQAADAPQAQAGIFKRENQTLDWKEQVQGVDYAANKDIKLKYGDVLASKDKTVVFHFGAYQIAYQPFSVFRIQGVPGQEEMAAVPELLFGEAMFFGAQGQSGLMLLPGQSLECQGVAYLSVDEEKYSMAASITGSMKILPSGAEAPIELGAGTLLELGPTGETGEPEALAEEDVALYSEQTVPDDAPKVSLEGNQKNVSLEQLAEYWNKDRIILLVNGPETPAGLSISTGEHLKEAETQPAIATPVFGKEKAPAVKSMSFSASSGGEKTVDANTPVLSSVTIGEKTATIGDILNLSPKNIQDKTFAIKGKATAPSPESWTLIMKINGDEYRMPSLSSFEHQVQVQLDMIDPPRIQGVMIGDSPAQSFSEETVLTRENLTSGKMVVAGMATAGNNKLNYTIEFIAKDKEGQDFALGTFLADLDLASIKLVEVTVDNGSTWNAAKGTDDWSYSFTPSNEEKYKVKVRAFDPLDGKSEEQFEPYYFTYHMKTDAETLRDVFNTMMTAFRDKDRSTFMRSVAQDYATNLEDIRDYNDLESSLDQRFSCCSTNIDFSIQEVEADHRTKTGAVDFNWYDRNGVRQTSNYAQFKYTYEDGLWKLREVVDPNTFLRASRIAVTIELTSNKTSLEADGEQTASIRARVLDISGGIVADGVSVTFSTDNGSMNPAQTTTSGGYANSTYTASSTSGTATIQAASGDASSSTSITLTPITPPLPPD